MKRTIYFTGELKDKFGEKIILDSDNLQDVVKGIEANKPGFRKYLIDLADRELDLRVYNGDKYLNKDEAPLFPLKEGDVILSVAPAGASFLKSLAGAFLTIVGFVITPFAPGLGQVLIGFGTGLIAQGIAEYLAPEVKEQMNPDDTYVFNGPQNRFLAGQPIPVVYGEVRLGGLPINIQTVGQPFDGVETEIDSQGNIYLSRA